MTKKPVLAAAAALCAAWGGYYFLSGMKAPEVIRKLSGVRVAMALYALEHKAQPAAFEDALRDGKLEAAPRLKLPRHFGTAAVRNTPAQDIRDTGGWGYVNDPRNPRFGLVFIDCSHKDEKGRYWSEF